MEQAKKIIFCKICKKAIKDNRDYRACVCGINQVRTLHMSDCSIVFYSPNRSMYFLITGECDCELQKEKTNV